MTIAQFSEEVAEDTRLRREKRAQEAQHKLQREEVLKKANI